MQAHSHARPAQPPAGRTGLARALSKLGFCSRSQAKELITAGRVRVNGVVRRDIEWRVDTGRDRLEVEGEQVRAERKVYLMLNKPRGLVTTTSDEKGRSTVFECLAGAKLPFVAPVGRLDQASEGLLLFTNDTAWAAHLTDPVSHVEKTYHVQVDALVDGALLEKLQHGVLDEGELLAVKQARILRQGVRNTWLELVLDEGKNRQIRRLLAAFGLKVLRLVRVAIGGLPLGDLPKGAFRHLSTEEVEQLSRS
jgi:23S rRNA pseudouridine2605 synthase